MALMMLLMTVTAHPCFLSTSPVDGWMAMTVLLMTVTAPRF